MFVCFCAVVPLFYYAATWPTTKARCAAMLGLLVLLNLSQCVPLFCTVLLTPVCTFIFRILPDRGPGKDAAIAKDIISVMFSQTSFVILAALCINAIVTKCQLELRFANFVHSCGLAISSPLCLLVLMFGTMLLAGFCNAGLLMMGAILPRLRDLSSEEQGAAKTVLVGIMMSANLGGMLFPLSSA